MDEGEYYLRLARVALHNHGLNSDRPQALARWAWAAAKRGDPERGVIVTGHVGVSVLRAQTYREPLDPMRWPSKWDRAPVWRVDRATWEFGPIPEGVRELGFALERVREVTGAPTAHIVYREVCTGWVG